MSVLSKSDVSHIRTSLDRCDAEGLSRELGRARKTIERKVNEIRANERIRRLSKYAKTRLAKSLV